MRIVPSENHGRHFLETRLDSKPLRSDKRVRKHDRITAAKMMGLEVFDRNGDSCPFAHRERFPNFPMGVLRKDIPIISENESGIFRVM